MSKEPIPVSARPVGWSLDDDLEDIRVRAEGVWSQLRGARIFLTGGTGFIGCWLLETLRYVEQRMNLGIRVSVLTRNPEAFAQKARHLARFPSFQFITGDIGDFKLPSQQFDFLIHAATDASAQLNESDPRKMFDTIVAGTRHVLDYALVCRVPRVLFMSSGAVYGQQAWEVEKVPEAWTGGPNCADPKAAYAEGKRAAEMLCAIYAKQFGLEICTARIFALLGPYISLGIHFAAGNFIRDAMHGKPVVVQGNGAPYRSYLYASDLVIWLLTIMVDADGGDIYNVGSDEAISIKDLARRVASLIGDGEVRVLGAPDSGWNPGRYVPDTSTIRSELGVRQTVSLDESILRTALWNGWKGKNEVV